ncbi:regulator of chromosome condensation 1/beta-lactamase-inhibitor protein II [Scheffersomyces amazonensis]|uniref:regulator of chromosome condensation 1/beta-lactamase-inhibitor protein II n=1 Tax=Scheffersomyces amazonensis TaxID=1078765 RepID=UPI00315D58FE
MTYTVLACGSNGNFQLGIDNNEDQSVLKPVLFEINGELTSQLHVKPIKISSGGNHTLILLENGEVYSSGDNTHGQCGHAISSTNFPVFSQIIESNWKDISCGWEFSILVNEDNEIYICGRGLKGELGLGKNVTESEFTLLPVDIEEEYQIIEVQSSLDSTVVRLDKNRLLGWGNARKGQLGKQELLLNNKLEASLWHPRLLNFDVPSGAEFTYSLGRDYSVFYVNSETNTRDIKVFGKQIAGQLKESTSQIVNVKSMWSSVHEIVKSIDNQYTIESYGNNSHGQLYQTIENHPNILAIEFAIGSEHGLLLSPNNEVYAWGWGEHGNCGVQKKQKIESETVTFDYLNLLYNGQSKVILIHGGCATSWVVVE